MKKRLFAFLTVLLLLLTSLTLPVAAADGDEGEDEPVVLHYQYKPTIQGKKMIADPKKSPLWGLSTIFLGDSICYNKVEQLKDPTTAGWAGRIGPKYNMDWENLGVSGAKVTASYNNNLSQQLFPKKDNDYDLIVLQGGINDSTVGAPLGEISTGTRLTSFDQTTYAGSLETLLCFARKYFPEATVVYLIHHTTPNARDLNDLSKPNPPKGNRQDYVNITKAACEKWEVPYLNLYEDESFNKQVFDTQNNSKGCMFPDFLHLSSPTGYDTLTPYIISFLEDVFLREEARDFLTPFHKLSEELTTEERFTAIREACLAYTALSEELQSIVDDEYEQLLQEIEWYNDEALYYNEIAAEAIDVAVVPLQSQMDFLTGLWFVLRNEVLAEPTVGGDDE